MEKRRYALRYSDTELMQLLCMWRMGVPVGIIVKQLHRVGEHGVRCTARKFGGRRPIWYKSWLAQQQNGSKKIA